jgi:acyl-CoA synthetase (AMP-forming)/AMP-acid ligase II
VDELSWQVARVFHNIGLRKGDVVALVSTNRPEYVAIWVGLSRLGVVTALVNNSLRNMALQHSLKVVNPKVVIASADLCQGDFSFAFKCHRVTYTEKHLLFCSC